MVINLASAIKIKVCSFDNETKKNKTPDQDNIIHKENWFNKNDGTDFFSYDEIGHYLSKCF